MSVYLYLSVLSTLKQLVLLNLKMFLQLLPSRSFCAIACYTVNNFIFISLFHLFWTNVEFKVVYSRLFIFIMKIDISVFEEVIYCSEYNIVIKITYVHTYVKTFFYFHKILAKIRYTFQFYHIQIPKDLKRPW